MPSIGSHVGLFEELRTILREIPSEEPESVFEP
jgi:hypothetical protein